MSTANGDNFWEVRACDKVRLTKERGLDSVVIIAQAGQRIESDEPGAVAYWTHSLGGVFFYEHEDFVEQKIEILERWSILD